MWVIVRHKSTGNDFLVNLDYIKKIIPEDNNGNPLLLVYNDGSTDFVEGTLEDACYAIRTLEERGKVIRLHE